MAAEIKPGPGEDRGSDRRRHPDRRAHVRRGRGAYHAERDSNPPIRISYLRYVAEAPVCGSWPTNLAHEPDNVSYPNFGCATQRNFAAQIANPCDLLQPRSETPRASERRDTVWTKYVKGDTTNTKKSTDEKISTKNQD